MQRLFSTFPDGWPGFGLLLLRVGGGIPLICLGVGGLGANFNESLRLASHLIPVAGGILLLVGLWTPVAGVTVAIVELCSAILLRLANPDDRWILLLLTVLTAAVAMLGPGAWSVDARLYGRRRFPPR